MTIKKIAICTDFSENAHVAFDAALDLAKQYSASLDVLHVLPPVINPFVMDPEGGSISQEASQTLIQNLEEEMQRTYGDRLDNLVDHRLMVLSGHVSTVILNHLTEAGIDLAIMGAFGLSGMGLVIFGSVAKRIVHRAPCSVMIVRNRR
ncbi:MAG: universal stress protein [Desulfobacterales bacterium]|nr:universal stress protein [Desulfobacterales bacterium]